MRIVAPVVVKPDTVSKNASVIDGIAPDRIKGNDPIKEKLIQLKATERKPSFGESSSGVCSMRFKIKLIAARPIEI